MKIELTKEQRLEIYIMALQHIKGEVFDGLCGACWAAEMDLFNIVNCEPTEIVEYLPELLSNKPKGVETHWFPEYEKYPRIKVLENCIEQLKKN